MPIGGKKRRTSSCSEEEWKSSEPPKRNVASLFSTAKNPVHVIDLVSDGDIDEDYSECKGQGSLPVKPASRKRQRSKEKGRAGGKPAPAPAPAPLVPVVEDELWPFKYRPNSVSELAVHKKKIQEVREALEDAAQAGSPLKLVVLVGPAGCGKSTLILALAQELGWQVVEWLDTAGQAMPAWRKDGSYRRANHDFSVGFSSQIDDFADFLSRTAYCGLGAVLSIGSSSSKRNKAKAGSGGQLVLLEDLPVTDSGQSGYCNDHGAERQEKLRTILNSFIPRSPHPVVLILSAANEKTSFNAQLEGILGADLLNSPLVRVIGCNPIAVTALRKCLTAVGKAESIPGQLLKSQVEEVLVSCQGDIRQALMTMQVLSYHKGLKRKEGKRPSSSLTSKGNAKKSTSRQASKAKKGTELARGKDEFLTHFHALGRLLYGKREEAEPAKTVGDGERPPLKHIPEEVLRSSEMSISSAAAFMQDHGPHQFTDISELADAADTLSDADMFIGVMYSTSAVYDKGAYDKVFPEAYAESLLSRSVSTFNRHPSPRTFRPLGAPRLYEVGRQIKIAREFQRSFTGEAWRKAGLLWGPSQHTEAEVHTELIPSIKRILGEFRTDVALGEYLERCISDGTEGGEMPIGGSYGNVTGEIEEIEEIEDLGGDRIREALEMRGGAHPKS
ncbi:unnamed protein product [Chrysoparadoxa australica]